jgi:hypothetical protein
MAGFSVFVSDLPSISLKVLDFKVIKSVIKVFLSQTVHMSAPQPIGGVALFNQVLLLHPYKWVLLNPPVGVVLFNKVVLLNPWVVLFNLLVLEDFIVNL